MRKATFAYFFELELAPILGFVAVFFALHWFGPSSLSEFQQAQIAFAVWVVGMLLGMRRRQFEILENLETKAADHFDEEKKILASSFGNIEQKIRETRQEIARIEYEISSKLRGRVEEIASVVEELDHRTEPRSEKIWRRFNKGEALTPAEVSGFQRGRVLNLMELSVHYPSTEPSFTEFEYRHRSVSNDSGRGCLVAHGWSRGPGERWRPYHFWVYETESRTRSNAGQVRARFLPKTSVTYAQSSP